MHRILLREVVIDAPTETFSATRDFWAAALLAEPRLVERYPEFTALRDPASTSCVGLQDVGAAAARFHLDIETDHVDAEVARSELTRVQCASRGTLSRGTPPRPLL